MNYYNYFTEVEEHFQRKRGAQIWLSAVDWALIESWKEAGIPLAAALAGIDQAFEKFESGRRRDGQRPRALAYCAAAVMDAAAAMEAAAVGAPEKPGAAEAGPGFGRERIAEYLAAASERIASSPALERNPGAVAEIRAAIGDLIANLGETAAPKLEEIDRVLTVLDDKLYATLQQAIGVEEMVAIRGELAGELAPYRRTLRAEQLAMIERQFLQRRLLERARIPRLSLFYMG